MTAHARRQRLYRARQKDPSLRPAPRDLSAPKACNGCGETKDLSAFGVLRTALDGHAGRCTKCRRSLRQAERVRLKTERPDVARAEWAADARRWRAKNGDLSRARNLEASRKWRAADPERKNASCRAWRARNLDRARAIGRMAQLSRNARKRDVFVEVVDPSVVFARDRGVCGICTAPVQPEQAWHVDHVIPLAAGGLHSYNNVQLAHARCNLQKGARVGFRKAA